MTPHVTVTMITGYDRCHIWSYVTVTVTTQSKI